MIGVSNPRRVTCLQTLKAILPPLAVVGIGVLLMPVQAAVGLLVVSFGVADCFGRYRDFSYLARQKYLTPRLVDFYGQSFCGRNLITAISPQWRSYYTCRGYRWWHILPDGFPAVFLNKNFWRTLAAGHRR